MAEEKETKKPVKGETKPVEVWRDELQTPAWLFAAAKAKYNWPINYEIAEHEYKKAVLSASEEVIH